jgi:UDP-N-acetylmuramoyl-tripeptide--D-alanyl-D-alanine ligase
MKEICKKIVIFILTLEAKLVLLRFRPKVIALTGSVGKTTTKDAIYSALNKSVHIRKSQKTYNSEFGVPLTILGLNTGWSNPLVWTLNLIKGAFVVFSFKYPKWLVLEVGVDKPGDMKSVAKWLKPDVVVLTTFPTVPVHVEFFNSPEEVIEEKRQLVRYMKKDGALILNADDERVMATKEISKNKIYTYGKTEEADVYYDNLSIVYEDVDGVNSPTGMSFKVNYEGNSIPVSIPGVLGVQHVYPVVASLAVGISEGLLPTDMVNSLAYHQAPKGRMNIIEGVNKSTIIDDTYNASPIAMQRAIELLGDLEVEGKKIAVLGDMLEIGSFSVKEHNKIGALVNDLKIDYLITVGMRSEAIASEAIELGMKKENVLSFEKHNGVSDKLSKLITSGSAVLVKGSQSIRLEKVVESIMKNPDRKKDLLVRQDKEWESR